MAGEIVVSTINGAGFDAANVIINPEFTLNQRGAASRTAATGYNFDRWYYDGTRLLQGVEGNNLRAGTYVLSWSGSSTAEFSLNTAAASGQGSESYTAVTNGGTITIASVGSNNLWVRFSSDLTNLTRVKLSLGTEASGFVARPFGTELALCQRYYYRSIATDSYTIFGTGFVTSSTATQIYSALPVTMRASPTLNFSTCRLGDGSYPTVTSVGTFRGGLNSWGSEVVASGGGLTTGRGCIIGASNSTSAYIDASAEL
jgi:hypothetical protein